MIASHATGNSPTDGSRTNGAISLGEVQEDGTILWIASRTLRIEPNPYADTNGFERFFAYSSLAVLENGNIGVLYEPQPNNYIAYAEFNLAWILNGEQEGIIYEPNVVRKNKIMAEQPKWEDLSLTIHKGENVSSEIAAGDIITFTAVFNGAVFVAGQAALSFDMNGRSLLALYDNGSGTNTLNFAYEVKEEDMIEGETVISVIPQIHASTGGVVEGLRNESLLNSHDMPLQLYPSAEESYKNALIELIADAILITDEHLYTNDSWSALVLGKSLAQSVINDSSSTSITIQQAWHALTTAINNLKRKADDRVPVSSITVKGTGGASKITQKNGTLQMSAVVLPADADNNTVSWSVINGTGKATIDSYGLLTAISNGKVTVIAESNDGTGIIGQLEITISGQVSNVDIIADSPSNKETDDSKDKDDNKDRDDNPVEINPEEPYEIVFNDVNQHWALDAIQSAVRNKWFQGYADGTFRANSNITRAEMAAVIVRALKLEKPSNGELTFTDVESSHWAKEYIAVAAAHGIVNGMNNDSYAPNQSMTREQFAVMIVNAFKIKLTNKVSQFTDHNSISSWAAESGNNLVSLGLLSGYPNGSFQPKKAITRAETASILIRLEQQGYFNFEQ